MTKQDYIKFAKMLKDEEPNPESVNHATWNNIVIEIANIFDDDNPRFNRNRFLKACGLELEN